VPTRGRAFGHIGFENQNLEQFSLKILEVVPENVSLREREDFWRAKFGNRCLNPLEPRRDPVTDLLRSTPALVPRRY
jgi:hypothetical protein